MTKLTRYKSFKKLKSGDNTIVADVNKITQHTTEYESFIALLRNFIVTQGQSTKIKAIDGQQS